MAMDDTPHGAEAVPVQKKLDDLYALIDGIETAMFTTRRAGAGGRLTDRSHAEAQRRRESRRASLRLRVSA